VAEVPKAKPPEGKGKGLNAKVGGIPIWVIAVGVVAAIGVGLYLRSRSATAATEAAATPASGTDTTGGAGSAAASPPDLTPVEDLASALNGLSGILGAGSAGVLGGSGLDLSGLGTDTTVAAGTTVDTNGNVSPAGGAAVTPVGTQTPAAKPVTSGGTPASIPTGLTPQNLAGATRGSQVQVLPAQIIPNQNAFGGIVSDTKNAAGVRIIKYASGRVVEQAPGKSAYVAHK